MNALVDVLLFRKMLAPIVLQILFWAGIGGTLYGSGWLLVHGNWAWWTALLFGTLATRLIFELALLRFRAYASLTEIERRLDLLSERGAQP